MIVRLARLGVEQIGVARYQQRIAIGRGARRRFCTDHPARTCTIFDHHGHAMGLAHLIRHQTGHEIGGGACRHRDDQLDRPPRLRPRVLAE
jgi:hypothetical protein